MSPEPRITRRGVIGVAAAGAITATIAGLGGWRLQQRPIRTDGGAVSGGSRSTLQIPPLAEATVDADGTRVFELTAQVGSTQFLYDTQTTTWGYNGAFGGPTLRAREGESVRVEVTNELNEVTTAHWHGMKLPAKADGGPHQPIHPGETWTAEWTVEQPAATLWYHPHNHGTTEVHVYRGLSGLFFIDDEATGTDRDPLPHDYGVDDIPVVVSDRAFLPDGSFDETHRSAAGMLGDTILVNGTVNPTFEATRAETRLRILNASTARTYRVQLDGGSLLLVGTDAGLVPEPKRVDAITLTPGERVEVIVQLEPGETKMLRSLPHTLGLLGTTERASGTRDPLDLLELSRPATSTGEPVFETLLASAGGTLAAVIPPLDEPDERRTVTMQDAKINHRRMNMSRIDEVVTVGARERWFITNEHFLAHNLHIHNARFRIVSIGGSKPAIELQGWKDTVYAPPSRTVVIDVEFGTATDPHLPYMFHCHMLQHEDQGMMAQFVVVNPGEAAGPIISPVTQDGGEHDGH
ncbi:multicopper oxidase family protein [Leucobacter denitrificans]|uniref:Multicopper oxidase domain-containing protein n=1 Tax=Leucobacter denitrificans TaxID=683042 RepID=A0A7G9S4C1_9MICO|nr:multicopper oxidase domain-containing protein [Leucobacter denitrificans]QNN62696.1 multicopper oxidase domain-containing protein [Leucobacter denitrificans]